MGISPTVPKTVYKTPHPQDEVSELYTIFADVLPNASDPQKRWVVNEKHGWWDEDSKTFLHAVTTLSPNDPKHCVTIEEAHEIIDRQVLLRAGQVLGIFLSRTFSMRRAGSNDLKFSLMERSGKSHELVRAR
jgi:hypothetical protein